MARVQAARLSETKSDDTFQAAMDSAMESKDKTKLRQACVDFEGYFIQMMFKEMRKTVNTSDGLFPKGQAEKLFQEMLDEETAKAIAGGRGLGLADMMFKQLSQQFLTSAEAEKN